MYHAQVRSRRTGRDGRQGHPGGGCGRCRRACFTYPIGRKGEKGRKVRIANLYSQGVFSEGQEQPERNADWEGILEGDTVLAGDFNGHSRRWNQHATTQRNQTFLEDLMDRHDLHVHNDDLPRTGATGTITTAAPSTLHSPRQGRRGR